MSVWTIKWDDGVVLMIDQRILPREEIVNEYIDCEGVARAIETMVIRGAPAIGVAAAMGLALAARSLADVKNMDEFRAGFAKHCERMARTRPTAVNLFWAIERVRNMVDENRDKSPQQVAQLCADLAQTMHEEDIAINRRMGKYGARFLNDGDTVLTHCNAGALATAGYGTALGVIRAAVEEGKKIKVIADETRPFLQGARLTAWELHKDNIPVTVICDNMAGSLMKQGKIQKVITGADRVAKNGDAANKIGTYSVAVLARHHDIPFYVAAPLSTIDLECPTGGDIPIEQRDPREVTHILSQRITPLGVPVLNPAFDVTPADLIHALITEKGVAEPPNEKTVTALFKISG